MTHQPSRRTKTMGYYNTSTPAERIEPKFLPHTITATPAAVEAIDKDTAAELLFRHLVGDWGDVDDHDHKVNEQALANNERIMSVYKSDEHPTIWIITERGHEITTILTPNDY